MTSRDDSSKRPTTSHRGLRLAAATSLSTAAAVAALWSAGTASAGPSSGQPPTGTTSTQLAQVRAATAEYHDPQAAVDAGYVPTTACAASPLGAMGYHYDNPELAGQDPDPLRPSVLLYLPSPEGPTLAGVEYLQPDADQDTATDGDRPALFGRPFDGPMAGHEPGMPVHYDLHVWVWKHNPAGMFAAWNTAASC